MNVSPIADDITSATADPSTVLMPAVTFDLLTGFVFVAALVLACLVYRWMAPAPGSHVQTSKGERVMYAVGAAASVIVIGSYLVGGVRGFVYEGSTTEKPAPAAGLVLIGQETDPKQSEQLAGVAIALEEGVLTDREHLLGPDHPDTITARSNLATSYRQAGRTDEAVALEGPGARG